MVDLHSCFCFHQDSVEEAFPVNRNTCAYIPSSSYCPFATLNELLILRVVLKNLQVMLLDCRVRFLGASTRT
jgi:hypothetical protein